MKLCLSEEIMFFISNEISLYNDLYDPDVLKIWQ